MINIFSPVCNSHACLREGFNEYYYKNLNMKLISFFHHHCHFHQNCHYQLHLLFIISISIYTHFTKEKYIIKFITFFKTISKHIKILSLQRITNMRGQTLASRAKYNCTLIICKLKVAFLPLYNL